MNEEVKNNAAEATPQTQEAQEQASSAAPAENAQEAAPAEAQAQEPATEKNPRGLFIERMKAVYPDKNYDEDEEGLYNDAASYIDQLVKDRDLQKDFFSKLEKRLGQDPEEAETFLDWVEGVDLWTATARHKGAEFTAPPQEGTPEYDSWKQAGDERRKELDAMKAQVDEYRANAEASEAALREFAKENGLDEEQTAELESFIAEKLLPSIYAGKLDKDFYGFIQHGRNYDADIEGAREQGRVDGRNEKIEAEKKQRAGSGLPNGATGGNASSEVDDPRERKARELSFLRG